MKLSISSLPLIDRPAFKIILIVCAFGLNACPGWAQQLVRPSEARIKISKRLTPGHAANLDSTVAHTAYLFDCTYTDCTANSRLETVWDAKKQLLRIQATVTAGQLYYLIVAFHPQQYESTISLPPYCHSFFADSSDDNGHTLMPMNNAGKPEIEVVTEADAVFANHFRVTGDTDTTADSMFSNIIVPSSEKLPLTANSSSLAASLQSSVPVRFYYRGIYQVERDATEKALAAIPLSYTPFFIFDTLAQTDVTQSVTLDAQHAAIRAHYANSQTAITDAQGRGKLFLKKHHSYCFVGDCLSPGFVGPMEAFSVERSCSLSVIAMSLNNLELQHRNAILIRLSDQISAIVHPDGDKSPDEDSKILRIEGPTVESRLRQWERLEAFLGQIDDVLNGVQDAAAVTPRPTIDVLVPLYGTTPSADWLRLANTANGNQYASTIFWAIVNPNSGPTNDWQRSFSQLIRMRSNRFRMIGYVSAVEEGQPLAEIAIVNKASQYGRNCDGVFLDNCAAYHGRDELQRVYAGIKQQCGNQFAVFANPGSVEMNLSEPNSHLTNPIADYFCFANSEHPDYRGIGKSVLESNQLPMLRRPGFGAIHYGVAPQQLQKVLELAAENGLQFLAATDLTPQSNSLLQLPNTAFLDMFLAMVESHNQAAQPQFKFLQANPPLNAPFANLPPP